MGEREDSAWVFDSLVGFLQGPIWSSPLLTFIEEKSLIFEADTEDSREYREIYQEYKSLVDLLLGCYMEDMEITPEQFEHACAVNKNTKMPVPFQQCLFEQIWAANEYEIFKRMMVQKNLELQLQALNMIEQKYGLTPASLTCETEGMPDEELVMEQLLHKQIMEDREDNVPGVEDAQAYEDEHVRLASKYKNEKVLLEQAIKASAVTSETSSPEPERWKTDEIRDDEGSTSFQLGDEKNVVLKKFAPLQPIPKMKKESVEDKTEPSSELFTTTKLNHQQESPEEMKKREDYLKARRDKLVALKKQARSRRLEMTKARPGSAKIAAEASMRGNQDYEVSSQIGEPSIIQVRKALAARLKAEVVRS